MGGLWVDYNLMSTVPGLFVVGEANFSDHGANRLGASALMQGLADGYFILPYTIGNYFASSKLSPVSADGPECTALIAESTDFYKKLLSVNGKRPVDSFHRELGTMMWNNCGMARNEAGLKKSIEKIGALKEEFLKNVIVTGQNESLNSSLEKAGRVYDFFDLADMMCRDALERKESCGGHFREEFQTAEGEAKRNDSEYCHVAVWEYANGKAPIRHQEALQYEGIKLQERSYK
jgi:succinate dehydrogenase / fumarate reductase flavoprotein subunit